MPYYLVYCQRGRSTLADDLRSDDPFGLEPLEIIDRVFALGSVPDAFKPRDTLWPTIGSVSEVVSDEGTYLVAIGRDAEEISVQEVEADAYDPVE